MISWLSWWVWSTWRERSLAACSQSWRPIARCSASSRSWRCSVSRPSVLVANRALEPLSKLASTTWVAERVAVPGLDTVDVDSCYRSMDWLLEIEAELAEAVSWSTADLLNLEVDLLFFDTTSTYFEIDNVGFGAFGHSKDHRPDLPQVVIGMAVTRTGIPIRVWCWPGNTNDSALIRQVKDDLRAWKLTRVVWVADRGFSSAENRRYLQRAVDRLPDARAKSDAEAQVAST